MTELSPYQRDLRDRLSSVPVLPAPAPWQPVFEPCAAVGGLLGIGFATHPESGNDLLMVVSTAGCGCLGLGPVTGGRVHIAGLYGGGLHPTTADGRQWRSSRRSGPTTESCSPADGERWWHVFHSDSSELRTVGFSPPAVPSPWRRAAT